jgi:hypothetical protein
MVSIEDLIDDTEVPSGQRSSPRYYQSRQFICDELAIPGKIEAVCLHEIGHVIYLEQINYPTQSEKLRIKTHGPTICYDSDTKRISPSLGSVGSSLTDTEVIYSKQLLTELTKVAVAGAIFVQIFAPKLCDSGDTEDDKLFDQYYRETAKKTADKTIASPLEFLIRARISVYQDLLNEAFRGSVQARAKEYELRHYSSPFRYAPPTS